MNLVAIRDTGEREARGEKEQLAATGGPEAVAEAAWEPGRPSREEIAEIYRGWMEEERAQRIGARGERGLGGTRLADTTAGAVIRGIPVPSAAPGLLAIVPPLPQIDLAGSRASTRVIPRTSALRDRLRELRDMAPAREVARLLNAAGRWLRPHEPRTAQAAFRMAFTLPETPSAAEMTIIETPFRIPRYMDHPDWRPW